jgi:23S rRNA G2445 N2-methylase RlmL
MRERKSAEVPALFALVHPGLESIAGEELTRDLGADIKKIQRGLIVFRVNEIDPDILKLRTVEDVFLLAWGTDSLTYRATDLKQIRQWTSKEPDWQHLLRIHHGIHPKPKGKPTYRLVAQMQGKPCYRRVDARDAMAEGLRGVFPDSWKYADENAAIEVWLRIDHTMAVCGVRLSDRLMRHRVYKQEHLPASLRPTIAAAMVRLAGAAPGQLVIDPMCGAGTILAEQIELSKLRKAGRIETLGGDLDLDAIRAAMTNLKKVGPTPFACWNAMQLPLANESVDRIVSNPPFGKQLSTPEEIVPLYKRMIREADRILRPEGRAVYLVSDPEVLREAIQPFRWVPSREYKIEVLGQNASISVWQKPMASGRMSRKLVDDE